jgi:DNA-binding NarL/FixJ family response regulator
MDGIEMRQEHRYYARVVPPAHMQSHDGARKIRVLLCHQHPLFRSSLRTLLESESKVRIIGEAANGREALILAEYCSPDIVVMDVKFAQPTGIGAARMIASKLSNAGIIFVGVDADAEYVSEAFKAGARGYVLADSAPSELLPAIEVVADGGCFLSATLSGGSLGVIT